MTLPFIKWFRKLLHLIVDPIFWVLWRPISGIHWLKTFRVEVWVVEGEERTSHQPLAVLCACTTFDKAYVLNLLFGESYREKSLGYFWLWNLERAKKFAGTDCSLLVTELFYRRRRLLRLSDWFLIPSWLHGETDLPVKSNPRFRQMLRKHIGRNNFHFEITTETHQFDDWFHNMYIPKAQAFGNCMSVYSYDELQAMRSRCDMLLIKDEHQAVAGALIEFRDSEAMLFLFGIRDNDPAHFDNGLGSLTYHFSCKYLEEKGYKKASLGYSRPFLNDGVLQYKAKWRQRFTNRIASDDTMFAMRFLSNTSAANAFMCNNPFIFSRDGVLNAAVFVNGDALLSEEQIVGIHSEKFHPGCSRLFIYFTNDNYPIDSTIVPAALSEVIKLQFASRLFRRNNTKHDRPIVEHREHSSLQHLKSDELSTY